MFPGTLSCSSNTGRRQALFSFGPAQNFEMAPGSPRMSVDSLASGVSVPSSSHYPLSPIDSSRGHHQKHLLQRRGSTASSITSVGGILGNASYPHEPIAEASQNGTPPSPAYNGNLAYMLMVFLQQLYRVSSSLRLYGRG